MNSEFVNKIQGYIQKNFEQGKWLSRHFIKLAFCEIVIFLIFWEDRVPRISFVCSLLFIIVRLFKCNWMVCYIFGNSLPCLF